MPYERQLVTDKSHDRRELEASVRFLLVHDGFQYGYGEVRELTGALVELQPPYSAMFLQIVGHPRLGNPQVIGEAFLESRQIFGRTATSDQIPDRNSQSLARLHVVVGYLV